MCAAYEAIGSVSESETDRNNPNVQTTNVYVIIIVILCGGHKITEHRYECDSIDNGFNNAYAYSDGTIIVTFRCIIALHICFLSPSYRFPFQHIMAE